MVAGVHGQMKTPQPLDGNNRSPLQKGDSLFNGSLACEGEAMAVVERDARTTVPTGIGLSMKATVCRVFVLRATDRTHFEFLHGGHGTVIGYVHDNGIARTAVRTINEGIFEATIFWVS